MPEWVPSPARGSQSHDAVIENRYILLVEDDPDLRDAVAEILTDEGFRVVRSADGREALAALKSGLEFCAIRHVDREARRSRRAAARRHGQVRRTDAAAETRARRLNEESGPGNPVRPLRD